MAARSKARKRALDVLFEADQRGAPVLDVLRDRIAEPGTEAALPQYSVDLVEGVLEHRERIDEALSTYSQGWTLERMPAVARAILRLGAFEVLFADDVPDAVAVDEAVELARALSKLLHDKIVKATNNAYAERDGDAAREASAHPGGSSAWAAAMLPRARWVKAFNTVYYEVLAAEAHRGGPRVGIPLASDDVYALSVVAQLVRDAGFDPVVVGPLARGREFEPGTPPYNTGMTGEDLRRLLGVA